MEDSQALAGNLGTIAKVITSLFNQVQAAPAHLLGIIALFFLGMLLKASPLSNRTIPWIIVAIGTCGYPFLASAKNIDSELSQPAGVLAVFGFILGFGAIGLHVMAKKSEKYRAFEAGFINVFRRDDTQPQKEKE